MSVAAGLFLPGALVELRDKRHQSATGHRMSSVEAPNVDTLDLNDRSPAHAAAAENRLDDLCAAIECGTTALVRADRFGKLPLQYVEADMSAMERIVRLAIRSRQMSLMVAKTLCGGRTLLHWVVSVPNKELLDAIQSERSRTSSHESLTLWDAVDENGSTPLHIACETGRLDIVAKLINANASRMIADKKGRIPLQLLPPHLLEVLRMSM